MTPSMTRSTPCNPCATQPLCLSLSRSQGTALNGEWTAQAFSSKADETSDPAVQRTDLAHYLKEVQRLSKMQFRSKVLKEKIEERRQVIQASR